MTRECESGTTIYLNKKEKRCVRYRERKYSDAKSEYFPPRTKKKNESLFCAKQVYRWDFTLYLQGRSRADFLALATKTGKREKRFAGMTSVLYGEERFPKIGGKSAFREDGGARMHFADASLPR